MWYWAVLAFTSSLKYGKHLFILFQKTENSLWACSISSSRKMMCAGYSRRLATSRSARSFGDPMATAKVRDAFRWARHCSSCVYHFLVWPKYHAAPRTAPLTLGGVTFLLRLSLSACAWEEEAGCVVKHTSPTGCVSPYANWCLPSEHGLYIPSRCALPSPLNRITL